MGPLSIYILKTIVVSGVFTAWYLVGLRGCRIHLYNRFFLLSALLLSVFIPFLHFNLIDLPTAVSSRLSPVSLVVEQGNFNAAPASRLNVNQVPHIPWGNIIVMVSAFISLALLVLLAIRLIIIRRLGKQFPITQIGAIKLVHTDLPNAPYTFFHYLFWNNSIQMDGEIGQLIFRHEATHILQKHTHDKLFCQILTCIFWFNPFFWVIQKELNLVHEFIADEHAIKDRDTQIFALMVLKTYNNGSHLVPQHHFFSSTIKRRLTMLQNIAEPTYAAFRQFMVLPILAIIVLVGSCNFNREALIVSKPAKNKIVVLVDPAHGGTDAGFQFDGLSEKELSLKLATRLKELAQSWNIDIQLTRPDDRGLSLAERIEQEDKVKPNLFLSLHINNEAGTEKAKGDFDIYVSAKSRYAAQSSSYSTAIFNALQQANILPDGTCKHGPNVTCENCEANAGHDSRPIVASTNKERIYLLKNSKAPCLVMILGNIKNPDRMKQYTDASRLDIICNAILNGIVNTANGHAAPDVTGPTLTTNNNNLAFTSPVNSPTPTCNSVSAVPIDLNKSQ